MVIVGGENLIDLVQMGTDSDLPIYKAIPGGSPFNLAMAAARQDVEVHYLTPISTDSSGDLLAARLVESKVHIAAPRHSAPSSLAMVTLNQGIPTYSFYREATAERHISNKMLAAVAPQSARIFHIGSLGLSGGTDAEIWEAFATSCKEKGMLVSLDPNVRPSLISDAAAYRARMNRMMAMADILKLSDEDLDWLYQDKDEDAALTQLTTDAKGAVIVLTRGADGADIWHEGAWHHIDSAPVPSLADTVGAGDTFSATMLAWLVRSDCLDSLYSLSLDQKLEMLAYAGRAAAINCGRQGCNPPWQHEMSS